MTSALRILLLEDDARDAELVGELLQAGDVVCDVIRAQTRAEFLAALEDPGIELILADYKLPSFDGISALKLALGARPELPFIFVSGTLGEEVAIEALKLGATDYLVKGRLSRLLPAVRRALREARERGERRKAEEALRRSEMYLAEAQRLSQTGSFGWDPASGALYWSAETYRIFACDPTTKPTALLVIDRTHPDDRAHLRQVLDRAATEMGEFIVEHRLLLPDGSLKYVRAVARRSSSEGPERPVFVGAVTDVTERRRAEATLREQANLLDLTHDAVFVTDADGVITFWNRGAEALYGWPAEQAKGQIASALLNSLPFSRIKAELLRRGSWEGEVLRTRRDGSQVMTANRWSLQRNAQGEPTTVLATSNDITERRRAEAERARLRELEADLARIHRVSMMGELAASLGHEIKQPITAAVMHAGACARWLRHDPPDVTQARAAAAALVTDAMRASDIIDRVGSLYRRDTPRQEPVQLNDIVREMTVLLRDRAGQHDISIRAELDSGLPETPADRVQLQQVLMNLMLNGIEAMQDTGGELTVASHTTEDGQLSIAVRDAGSGLPADARERLFETFFTTKPQGTGMGLSISRRIVESHGGRLWASENTGPGATFQFTLPGS